jgi:hypothetical protein
MGVRRVAVVVGALLLVTVPRFASAQVRSPLGGSSAGTIVNGINDTARRPLPAVPSTPSAAPDTTWVPDRYVQSPLDGQVLIPGHWERHLSDHQVMTPPLLGRTPDGRTITFPADTRPPVGERQAP